jgi:photosystem II stability/assembly factor-like uncharacterized protein
MSDFERLTGQLRQDVSRARWPGSDAIRARADRSTSRRVAAGAGLAVVIVLAVVAVVAGTLQHRAAPIVVPPATTPPAVTPSGGGATPSPTPTPAAGPGLAAREVSFPVPGAGWLLAAGPRLLRTSDGAVTWTDLPPLPPDVPAEGAHITFADSRIGYLYGHAVLYLTTDGGTTWTKQAGGAEAIDVSNGTALRVGSSTGCIPPGCMYDISTAPAGSAAWHTVKAGAGTGIRVGVGRSGRRVLVVLFQNLAGGASAVATVFTSADDGATWTTRPDPCGDSQGAERVSTAMTMAPDGSITLLCQLHTDSSQAHVITSTDGGVTFGSRQAVPAYALSVGAASATTLFASVLDGRAIRLYRSDDAGANWAAVATAPEAVSDGSVPPSSVVFPSSSGWWMPGYATSFTTSDGGRTWKPFTIH